MKDLTHADMFKPCHSLISFMDSIDESILLISYALRMFNAAAI